jgi:hypothetical protein
MARDNRFRCACSRPDRRGSLDDGPYGRDLGRTLRGCRLEPVGHLRGAGRQPGARHADDVRLDHDVVGAAHKEQVLDVVAPQEDELPMAIEVVDVDDAKPGLAGAAAVVGERQPPPRQSPQDQGKQSEERKDDREGDQVLHGWRQILDARN